jgi:hypothetical protein
MWVSEGVKIDPMGGDILADTGQLAVETKPFTVVAWTDAGDAELEVVLRDETDTTDVNVQRVRAQTTPVFAMPLTLTPNQRLIVRLRVDLAGHIQVSILA